MSRVPAPFVLVLPVHNEADVIETTVQEACTWLRKTFPEGRVVAVNDGSSDNTGPVLEKLRGAFPELAVVQHARNRGYGAALCSGLDACPAAWLAYMDADGQFAVEDLERLWGGREDVGLVAGLRVQRADPAFRTWNARLYRWLLWRSLGLSIPDIDCGMKLIRGDLWARIRPCVSQGALFTAEMFVRLRDQGESWRQVPVRHFPRRRGKASGASAKVVWTMFRELRALRKHRSQAGRGTGPRRDGHGPSDDPAVEGDTPVQTAGKP